MLFDIENDPHEIENLAQNPDYQNVLEDLRQALTKKIKKLPDLSFYPESVIVSQALDNPVAFGQRHRKQIGQLIDIADLQLRPFKKARKRIRSALESGHPWERYWGLIVCGAFGKEAARFEETAKVLAQTDPEPLVRSRAAEFLGLAELANPERYLVNALRSTRSEVEAHLILNTITLLRDSKFEYEIEVNPLWLPDEWRKDKKGNVARRLEYLK